MNALRDLDQALGSVIDSIHRRHIGQERLRGADVTGGFVSADVLFPGLHGHSEGGFASRVDRHTDDTSRHLARTREEREGR